MTTEEEWSSGMPTVRKMSTTAPREPSCMHPEKPSEKSEEIPADLMTLLVTRVSRNTPSKNGRNSEMENGSRESSVTEDPRKSSPSNITESEGCPSRPSEDTVFPSGKNWRGE